MVFANIPDVTLVDDARKDKMPEMFCPGYQEYIDSEGKVFTTLERCLVVSSWAKTSRHAAAKKP